MLSTLVVWIARWTDVLGMSKARETTRYDVPLANQNRKTRQAISGSQPWSALLPMASIRALNDPLDKRKSTCMSLAIKITLRIGTASLS